MAEHRTKVAVVIAYAAAAVLLPGACGSDSAMAGAGGAGGAATATAGTGGGAAGNGEGTAGMGGGTAGMGGGAAGMSGGAGASAVRTGFVEIRTGPRSSGDVSTVSELLANFIVWQGAGDVCPQLAPGPCVVTACGPGATPLAYDSAGTLTFSSGNVAAELPQLANGTYNFVEVSGGLWSGAGAAVTVTAPGGDVAAFTEQLSAPAILTMSPSVFTGVSRGHDIAIIWQGGGACRATFEFDAYQGGSTYTVMCSFPSTDGSGTIPAAALQVFPSGLIVNYTATCDVTSDMAVGPWDISARAFEQARTPSGGPVLGSLGSW